METSDMAKAIQSEFSAREAVIADHSKRELPPFAVMGDMTGFRSTMSNFESGKIDASQAIEELTQLLEKYYAVDYPLPRETRGPSWNRW